MTIQPIDPALLDPLCRHCCNEALVAGEMTALEEAGLANVAEPTAAGVAYLVRALRLSELRGKWLEAQIAERNTYDNLGVFGRKPWEAARKAEKEAREAYKAAGGAL